MNNHISDVRTGNSTDKFDLHVHKCSRENNNKIEPFFQIHTYLTVPHESMLLPFDTMN